MAITNEKLAELMGTVTVGADNTATLNAAYQKAFGRDADADGLTYWGGRLDDGLAVADLMTALLGGVDKYPTDGTFATENTADKAVVVNKTAVAEAIEANTFVTPAEAATILATVTSDAATVTSATASVDAITDPALVGETFVLTTAATDSFIGTALNDSATATQATYNTGDLVIDATSTDNDLFTLNTTSNITATPTVSGFENIVLNAQKAGTFSFAGTNVSGATKVTVNREDLLDGAIDGTGAVSLTGMRATNFVAGEKVSAFSVAMDATSNIATVATVDATNATGTVTVSNIGYAGTTISGIDGQDFSVTGTTAKATVYAAGEVSGTNAVDQLTVEATDTLELTLDAIGTGATSDELTLAGDADITLNIAVDDLTTEKITNNATGIVIVNVTAAAGGAGTATSLDLTDVAAVTSVQLDDDISDGTEIIVIGDSQLLTTAVNQTDLTIDNIDTETTGSFKFAVLDNETEDTAVTLGAVVIGANDVFDSVYLDATANELTATTVDVNDMDVILTGAKTITLGTVTDANSIVSSATGTVDMTVNGNTANEMLVALGAGDDTLVVDGATDVFTVQTGAGVDTLTITDAAADSVFTTNDGADLVTVADGVTGSVSLSTGTGNDTVTYDEATTAHTVDLGTGNNTLKLSDTIVADTEFTLGTGNNKIMVTAAADTTDADITGNVSEINLANTLSISSAQFNAFGAFSLTGTSASALTIDASGAETTTAQTIDASVITLGYGVTSTVAINASGYGDTITGTIGDDAITMGAGDDVYIFGAPATNGNDTITAFNTAGDDTLDITSFFSDLVGTATFAEDSALSAAKIIVATTASLGTDATTAATAMNTDIDTTGVVTGTTLIAQQDSAGNTQLWLYQDDANAAAIEAGELTLIGTIDTYTAGAGDWTAADFVIA